MAIIIITVMKISDILLTHCKIMNKIHGHQ